MVEISILKDQVEVARSRSSNIFPPAPPSDDDLLKTSPPPDLQLDELSPSMEALPSNFTIDAIRGPSAPVQDVKHQDRGNAPVNSSRILRSSNLPSLQSPVTANSRISGIRSFAKQPNSPRVATTPSNIASTTVSKNKGVQMVSEMRARVRNLEQKIHTRVPRLRMGSITGKAPSTLALTSVNEIPGISSSSSSSSRASTAKTSWESLAQRPSGDSRRSNDDGQGKKQKEPRGDSSGWVLILEDSPSPPKGKGRERRRISSPSQGSNAPRTVTSTSIPSPSSSSSKYGLLNQSVASPGMRRPQSRLSAGSLNTASSSSIPTPVSRPATPTYLPLPSYNGMTGLKRSTGPSGSNLHHQTKRSSLGSGDAYDVPTIPPLPITTTPLLSLKSAVESTRALPPLSGLHSNITMRPQGKIPGQSYGISALGQSRIGRPSGSGRKSTDNIHTT